MHKNVGVAHSSGIIVIVITILSIPVYVRIDNIPKRIEKTMQKSAYPCFLGHPVYESVKYSKSSVLHTEVQS